MGGRERVRDAFDIETDDDVTRRSYGMHTFGQSALVARRLIRAWVLTAIIFLALFLTWGYLPLDAVRPFGGSAFGASLPFQPTSSEAMFTFHGWDGHTIVEELRVGLSQARSGRGARVPSAQGGSDRGSASAEDEASIPARSLRRLLKPARWWHHGSLHLCQEAAAAV